MGNRWSYETSHIKEWAEEILEKIDYIERLENDSTCGNHFCPSCQETINERCEEIESLLDQMGSENTDMWRTNYECADCKEEEGDEDDPPTPPVPGSIDDLRSRITRLVTS